MSRDHDPRSYEPERPDPSRAGRSDATAGQRGQTGDYRTVFARSLALPRGPDRERVWAHTRAYDLRGSEVRTLSTVGAFRVVPAAHLRETDDTHNRLSHDLRHLRDVGLVRTLPYVVGRERTTLVTLTQRGRDLLEECRLPERGHRPQVFYDGIVKPRELAHDSRLYQAYLHAAERLHGAGARVHRVVLDAELKRDYQQFLQAHNRGRRDSSGRSDRTAEEIARWAHEHQLPIVDEHVAFPDVRIEYEDRGRARPRGRRGGDDAALSRCARCRTSQHGILVLSRLRRSCGRDAHRTRRRVGGPTPRGRDVAMTFTERVGAVSSQGFTERQAGFLVTVMLHAGVCLGRQYCSFAGIVRGQKTHDFFGGLVADGLATCYPRAHRKTHVYHVHAKALYRAIGEAENRHRRPVPLGRAIERLMVLDTVLAEPDVQWLATEREKLAHFTVTTPLRRQELPHLVFGRRRDQTIRYFPDKLPIGVSRDGRAHVFVYLATRALPIDFRAFLHRHAELFRALPCWTLRLLMPRHLSGATPLFEAAFKDEIATPLRPSTLDELRWYFGQRQVAGDGGPRDESRYGRARSAFAHPRYRALYRAWAAGGEAALLASTSPVLADAVARGTGTLEIRVLARSYHHLSPLVGSS